MRTWGKIVFGIGLGLFISSWLTLLGPMVPFLASFGIIMLGMAMLCWPRSY